jgi:hypothetical protein
MAGGGRVVIKGGRASKGEAVVEDGAVLITGITIPPPPVVGPPQEPWFEGMSTRAMWFTDFDGGSPVFTNSPILPVPAGAGALAFNAAALDLTNHPGIISLTTGSTTAGRVFLLTNTPAGYHFGFGRTRTGTWLETSALLSTVLQRYTLRSGWFSITLPNTILYGVGFEYQDNQNGGRWQAITADGIGETSTDTGVLVAGTTWYKLEVEVNAAGTSVDYFIDDVLVATNVTDIPSGTGFSNFYNTHIMKIIGTAPRTLYVDAAYGYQEVVR